MAKAELLLDARATLGEGPGWDAGTGTLIWVDILEGRIHRYRPKDGHDEWKAIGQFVGAAVPRAAGGLMVAARNGFFRYAWETGSLEPVLDPEPHRTDNRFNDGKCDSRGRFWAGTMAMSGAEPAGALYRLGTDGRVTTMLTGVSCSNGIAWSPDERTMYYIDSPTGRVEAFDFDPAEGTIANRRTVVEIPPGEGIPDGMTSDAEGRLWVAQWDGWQVSCWDPATGKRLEVVDVPAARVTSCVFGGERLDELYMTTARTGLSDAQLREQPEAGGLFRYRAGVRGMPTHVYGG